jgi:hypothetical protein
MGCSKAASKGRALVNWVKERLRKPATLRVLMFVLRVIVWIARHFDSLS